jgi:hypothetical protein
VLPGGTWCFAHDPGRATERTAARRKGGHNRSNVARLRGLCPPRLINVFEVLEKALGEVHDGTLAPSRAVAMASLAPAMTRVLTAGELEQRLRDLEQRAAGKVS